MSAILRRISEVAVHFNFTMYLYIGLANQHEDYGRGGIQNNLEICRKLKGTVYTSPVQKKSDSPLGDCTGSVHDDSIG